MVKIDKIDNFSSFLSLKTCWNTLLEKSRSDNVFLTFEWLTTWWEVFGEDKELCLLLIKKEGGEAIGIAPLMVRKGFSLFGRRLRYVEFIGSGKCDYHDFIIVDRRNEVITAIFDFFLKEYHAWDLIKLRHIREISPNLNSLSSLTGFKKVRKIVDKCPYIPIKKEKDWDTYFQNRGKNLRKDFRKKYKRLSKIGDICFLGSSGEFNQGINQFRQIYEKRYKVMGKCSTFFKGKEMVFFRRIHYVAQTEGWVKIFLLKLNNKIIGYRYGLLYKQKFYDWVTSFDPDFFEYSPGKLLIGEAIKFSMENNIKEFDFLRGDEKYKLKWTKITRSNYELFFLKNNILGSILSFCHSDLMPKLKSSIFVKYFMKTKLSIFFRKRDRLEKI